MSTHIYFFWWADSMGNILVKYNTQEKIFCPHIRVLHSIKSKVYPLLNKKSII